MPIIINFFKKILLITATQFLFSSSCKKDGGTNPCINSTYEFNVTSEFSPQREVYNVGDTLYFNSSFNKNLFNTITLKQVDYSNSVGISGGITFGYMDTVLHTGVEANSKFEMVSAIGTFLPTNPIVEQGRIRINFIESASYQFKSGIKLREKGLYVLAANNLGSNGLNGQNCTNATFDMTVTNTNKHISLFQYALGYLPDALAQKSIYCFRVQ